MGFLAGFRLTCTFAVDGGGGQFQPIVVAKHDWEEAIDKLDVTSSGMGGLQALLAGILRGSGNVSGYCQSGALPWGSPPGVRAGSTGQFALGIGSSVQPFSIPAMVTKLKEQSDVAGRVEYSFTIDLDFLGGTGAYSVAL